MGGGEGEDDVGEGNVRVAPAGAARRICTSVAAPSLKHNINHHKGPLPQPHPAHTHRPDAQWTPHLAGTFSRSTPTLPPCPATVPSPFLMHRPIRRLGLSEQELQEHIGAVFEA